MRRGHAVLEPRDVQEALFEVHLVPTQRYQLADAQTMTIRDENQSSVAVAIPANSARRLDELFDFLRRQVLAGSPIAVRDAPGRSHFPSYDCRRAVHSSHIRRRSRGGYRMSWPFWGLFGKVSRNAHCGAVVA